METMYQLAYMHTVSRVCLSAYFPDMDKQLLEIITLLAKSGQLSSKTPAINNAETDLYDELIKNIGNEINYGPKNCPPVSESKEIVYEEK
ncbi:hypothetical protein ACSBR2_034931 [Camellia fascicularis]